MKQKNNLIKQVKEKIETQGLVAIEDIRYNPKDLEFIMVPYSIVFLCKRGWIRGEYDYTLMELHEHDFTLFYPNHIIKPTEVSDDFLCTLLIVSPKFHDLLNGLFPDHFRFEFHFNIMLHLNDQQYEAAESCMRQLHVISRVNHPDRRMLLAKQVDITANLVDFFMNENGIKTAERLPPAQQLLSRFINAISEHFHESRKVRFYAELLNLTPKHFGTIIRHGTGTGAGEWIARYVIMQAKHLLRHHHDLSIQQISDSLGFQDQAAFTRYFKKYSGQNPQEFRGK